MKSPSLARTAFLIVVCAWGVFSQARLIDSRRQIGELSSRLSARESDLVAATSKKTTLEKASADCAARLAEATDREDAMMRNTELRIRFYEAKIGALEAQIDGFRQQLASR